MYIRNSLSLTSDMMLGLQFNTPAVWGTLINIMCGQFIYLYVPRLNIGVEEVQPSDREKAKRVVYAIVYGVGKQKGTSVPATYTDHICQHTSFSQR